MSVAEILAIWKQVYIVQWFNAEQNAPVLFFFLDVINETRTLSSICFQFAR